MFYPAIHYYVLMLYSEKQGRVQVLFWGFNHQPSYRTQNIVKPSKIKS